MPNSSLQNPIQVRYVVEGAPQQQKDLSTLEKIAQFNIVINLIIGVLIIFAIILIVAWRLDLINYLTRKSADSPPTADVLLNKTPERVVLAAENQPLPPVFISEQSVDIQKVFQKEPGDIHLTTFGKLKKEVFGFLPYWAMPKIDEINTKLLTTISFFGLEVDKNGNIIKYDANGKVLSPWFYFQSGPIFDKFAKRAQSEKIKVLVTLKCFNQTNIVNLVTSPKARANFITNALFLVESKNLDGLNIDFEYIGEPDKEVRDGFSQLIIELNKELKKQKSDSLLTIDTFADAASNTRIHDVALLGQHSDRLVIMGYDFHTPQSGTAGPIAPMEGYGNSLVGFMASYLEKVPAEKIILAVPYYGYDWPVGEISRNAKVSGTKTDVKILPYAEIADATENSKIQWDENGKTPWYSYKDSSGTTRVVHFENTRSLGIKYDFINEKKLAGVGIWALGFDGKREELLQLSANKFAQF